MVVSTATNPQSMESTQIGAAMLHEATGRESMCDRVVELRPSDPRACVTHENAAGQAVGDRPCPGQVCGECAAQAGSRPDTRDRGRPVVEPHHPPEIGTEEGRDLLRQGVEDGAAARLAGDDRGDPSQCRLLAGRRLEVIENPDPGE